MAVTLNEVRLIGNVGKDPDIRSMQDGKEVASFTLATSDVWKDKSTGERKERTEWHKIVVFIPHLVSVIKSHVKKGTRLYIAGSLQTRKWQDHSNVDKYITEILLQSHDSKLMVFPSANKDDSYVKSEDEDDIPF
jgi:single-strand DNA-binding protein